MHRPMADGAAPLRPARMRQLAAFGALLLTPVVGYLLGRLAWEQAHVVAASTPPGAVFGASTLTLGYVLTPLAAGVGALIAFHLTWTAAVMLAAPRRSRVRVAVTAVTPTAWRRLVTVATTGTLSVALAMPATAADGSADSEGVGAGWVAAPVVATGEPATNAAQSVSAQALPEHTPTPAQAPDTGTDSDADADQVVVAQGDTLWDITAAQLDLPASDPGTIAAAWPELYEQNKNTIGADPELIVPGQELEIPAGWTA